MSHWSLLQSLSSAPPIPEVLNHHGTGLISHNIPQDTCRSVQTGKHTDTI